VTVNASLHLTGAEKIADERARQIALGFGQKHDLEHDDRSLLTAAVCYIETAGVASRYSTVWPWDSGFGPHYDVTDLIRAGALIAAEIDRLDSLQRTAERVPS